MDERPIKSGTKLLLVLVVIALIAGVWAVRRWQDRRPGGGLEVSVESTPATGGATSSDTAAVDDTDALQATAIDLEELTAKGLPILINFSTDT